MDGACEYLVDAPMPPQHIYIYGCVGSYPHYDYMSPLPLELIVHRKGEQFLVIQCLTFFLRFRI
jgi:hypothetical protein